MMKGTILSPTLAIVPHLVIVSDSTIYNTITKDFIQFDPTVKVQFYYLHIYAKVATP